MRKLRIQLVLAVTVIATVMSGCQSPQVTPRVRAAVVPGQQSTPFLEKDQYPDRLRLAIDDSLRRHRFTRPWIAVRGPDGSVWSVAERFHSEGRFDRIYLRVAPDEHLTASITPYQFGPSDWAILGPLFADLRPEAELISREISSELRASVSSN
jgi:hypothetical protein